MGKNQFLKVENSLLNLEKGIIELEDRELKDREVKWEKNEKRDKWAIFKTDYVVYRWYW